MQENWRELLYYPLGLIPCLLFSMRFIVQWIKSEKVQVSYVESSFWKLSLAGNYLLAAHYFIQIQYIFFIIQISNIFISWRNLDFLQKKKKPLGFYQALSFLVALLLSSSVLFFIQMYFFSLNFSFKEMFFFLLSMQEENLSFFWSIIGTLGGFLFASRFWFQWWNTEIKKTSELNKNFWILSILGSAITVFYSIKIHDSISVINYSFGFIPCIRNLILQKKRLCKSSS